MGRRLPEPSSASRWPASHQLQTCSWIGNLLNKFSHGGHAVKQAAGSQLTNPQLPTYYTRGQAWANRPTHSSPSSGSSSESSSIGTHVPSSRGVPSSSSTAASNYAWIHLCIESYAGRVSLKTVDLINIATDGPMFSAIHRAYFGEGLLRALYRFFSLRVLTGVRCVHVSVVAKKLNTVHISANMASAKFNLDRYGRVAIDTDEDQNHALPNGYDDCPCPPKIVGLIPPQFLYYCISDPPLADRHLTVWRDRMAKYNRAELQCTLDEAFTQGYGLYFMEALSWVKVWIIMAVLAIISFTVSGLWVRYHQGAIQDGFAIGGSILAVATIVLGLIHSLDTFWSQRVRF